MNTDLKKFCDILKQLEAVELIGMARLLGVAAYKEKDNAPTDEDTPDIDFKDREKAVAYLEAHFEAKTGEEIIYEMCEKFNNLNRAGKRNILSSMKSLSKKR